MNIYISDGMDVLAWNDENFNGQTKEFTIDFGLAQQKGFETRIFIELFSIEKEYFNYMKSYSQNFTILNDDALIYEAVNVASNIEGGYGIIAAVSSSSVSFDYTF